MNRVFALGLTERKANSVISRIKRTPKVCRQTYYIVAIGLSKKGNVLGVATNLATPKPNFAAHAEGRLIIKYGNKLSKIVIARFSKHGNQMPIQPCRLCSKQAAKRGIVIEEVELI